jgi:WD40 repeat protein
VTLSILTIPVVSVQLSINSKNTNHQNKKHCEMSQQHQDGVHMPPSFSQAASQLEQLRTNLLLHHPTKQTSPSNDASPSNGAVHQQQQQSTTQQQPIQLAALTIPFPPHASIVTIDSEMVGEASRHLYYPPRQPITKLSTPYFSHIGTPIVTTSKYMVWSTPPGPLRIFHKMTGKRGFLKKHKGAVLDLRAIELNEGNNQYSSCILSIGSQDGAIIAWKVTETKSELAGKGLFRIRREGMFKKALFSQSEQTVYALTDDGNIITFDIQKVLGKDIVIENDDEFFDSEENKSYGMSKWTLGTILGNNTSNAPVNTTVDDDDDAQDRIVDIAISKDEFTMYLLTNDNTVVLYDLRSRQMKHTIPVRVDNERNDLLGEFEENDYAPPEPFTINVHGPFIIVGLDQNTTITFIDIRTQHQFIIQLPHENNESYHVYATDDLPYMIISNRNGDECYVYDYDKPRQLLLMGIQGGVLSCVAEMKGNNMGIFCLQPSGTVLVQTIVKSDASPVQPQQQPQSVQQQQPPQQPVHQQQPQSQLEQSKKVTFDLVSEQEKKREASPQDRLNAEDFEKMILKQHRHEPVEQKPHSPSEFSKINDLFKQLAGKTQQQNSSPQMHQQSYAHQQQQQQQQPVQHTIPEVTNPILPPQQTQLPPITTFATTAPADYLTKVEFYKALGDFESRMMNQISQLMAQFVVHTQQIQQQTIETSNSQQKELLKLVSGTLTNDLPEDLCEMMNQEIIPQLKQETNQQQQSQQIGRAVEEGLQRVLKQDIIPTFEGAFDRLTHRLSSELTRHQVQAPIPTQNTVPQVSKQEVMRKEIDEQIAHQNFKQALSIALSGSNLENLIYTLQHLRTDILPEMEQPIILSLVQQLAYDLSWDDNLKTKMDWLEQSVLFLEPSDDIVAYHGADILRTVLQNLKESAQQLSTGKTGSGKRQDVTPIIKRMKLMNHVVHNILVGIDSSHRQI